MNEIYLSGTVADRPTRSEQGGRARHTAFHLLVTHRNSLGFTRCELYHINTWNALADWVGLNLIPGTRVMLRGYLTQRAGNSGVSVEITAIQVYVGQSVNTPNRPAPPLPRE